MSIKFDFVDAASHTHSFFIEMQAGENSIEREKKQNKPKIDNNRSKQ